MGHVTRCYMTGREDDGKTVVFNSNDDKSTFRVKYEDVEFMVMRVGWHASVWRNDMDVLKARMD